MQYTTGGMLQVRLTCMMMPLDNHNKPIPGNLESLDSTAVSTNFAQGRECRSLKCMHAWVCDE